MTNPSKEHSVSTRRESGAASIGTGATHLKDDGAIAAPASNTQSEAGETSSSQPRSRSERLLVEALTALAWKGDVHAAAGVYARMRRIDSTFTFQVEGYTSFRKLLEAAAASGLIYVDRLKAASDLTVRLSSADGPSRLVAQNSSVTFQVRPELWQALLDWDPDARYLLSRTEGRVIKSPTLPQDEENILIPSISREEQLQWMGEFAASQVDEDVKSALLAALTEDVPVRAFSRTIRNLEPVGKRWKRHLKKRVLDRTNTWATEKNIPLSAIERAEAPNKAETAVPTRLTRSGEADDEPMKARVLGILASMPLSELLRLPIPVEYALKR